MLLFLVALLQMPYVLQRTLSETNVVCNVILTWLAEFANIIALEKLLWEKKLWFSPRLLLFYLLCYFRSMAAGQIREKFLSQLAVKTASVAKEPKNRDKKIGDIYLCRIPQPGI